MSNRKHTPGPWGYRKANENGDCGIYADGTGIFIEVFEDIRHAHESNKEQAEANAKLVIMAPDMLEILEKCLKDEKNRRKKLLNTSTAAAYADHRIAKMQLIINRATGVVA